MAIKIFRLWETAVKPNYEGGILLNPKITKVTSDIEKTKDRIAEHQSRLRELERLKTELENSEIVATVRSVNIPPADLEAFARAFMEQRKSVPVPDLTAVQSAYTEENPKGGLDAEG